MGPYARLWFFNFLSLFSFFSLSTGHPLSCPTSRPIRLGHRPLMASAMAGFPSVPPLAMVAANKLMLLTIAAMIVTYKLLLAMVSSQRHMLAVTHPIASRSYH